MIHGSYGHNASLAAQVVVTKLHKQELTTNGVNYFHRGRQKRKYGGQLISWPPYYKKHLVWINSGLKLYS